MQQNDVAPRLPPHALSLVLVHLMKGVLYQETHADLWQYLLSLQARVRDHVRVLGLELLLDEAEGYAFLRQRAAEPDGVDLPRLVARRQLSYPVSLLLVLLRRKLAEVDATGGDARCILSREEMVELVRVFLPAGTNEARLVDKVEASIQKVVDLGFLRRMQGSSELCEVRRIIKAFIDAQWLQEFDQRLQEYQAHAAQDVSA
ncbi:MAG: DUF4194 domain-containing protein [Myxococcota bacterium]